MQTSPHPVMSTSEPQTSTGSFSVEEQMAAEVVERDALSDVVDAMPAATREQLGVIVDRIGSATIVSSSKSASWGLNRACGLGLESPASRGEVEAVVERLRARSARFLVHVAPHARPAEIEMWLEQCGLERYRRSWWKLMGRLPLAFACAATEPSDVAVGEPTSSEEVAEVVALLARTFGVDAAHEGPFAGLMGRARWRVYRARRTSTGELMGAALLFARDGVGYLAGAAVTPEHRRRGVHRALIAKRLSDARGLGCRIVVAETGEDLPGEVGASLRNLARAGLERVSLRPNFSPRGMDQFAV